MPNEEWLRSELARERKMSAGLFQSLIACVAAKGEIRVTPGVIHDLHDYELQRIEYARDCSLVYSVRRTAPTEAKDKV